MSIQDKINNIYYVCFFLSKKLHSGIILLKASIACENWWQDIILNQGYVCMDIHDKMGKDVWGGEKDIGNYTRLTLMLFKFRSFLKGK